MRTTSQTWAGLREGMRQRDLALEQVEHATALRQAWVAKAKTIAERMAEAYGEVTSEQVRQALPIPESVDPRILGAVFRSKQWERVGFKATPRASAHARPISIWRLKR